MIAGREHYDAVTGEFSHRPVGRPDRPGSPGVCAALAGELPFDNGLWRFKVEQPPTVDIPTMPPDATSLVQGVADLTRTVLRPARQCFGKQIVTLGCAEQPQEGKE